MIMLASELKRKGKILSDLTKKAQVLGLEEAGQLKEIQKFFTDIQEGKMTLEMEQQISNVREIGSKIELEWANRHFL